MRLLYDLWYRYGTPPWVGGPRAELVELVGQGRIPPGRAIDLGCGTGDNAIFLAERGFDVTGVDFSRAAIEQARRKAHDAGVDVRFEVDDLTGLRGGYGTFDLLVDYGTFDDFSPRRRDAYLANVLPLTRPGSRFLSWCFEWEHSRMERALAAVLPAGNVAFTPGEMARLLGAFFEVERVAGETRSHGWPKGYAAYLMTRNDQVFP